MYDEVWRMSPLQRRFTFSLDEELAAGMKALKARDGIGEAEQVRRALRVFLEGRGILDALPTSGTKAARKRVGPRPRA